MNARLRAAWMLAVATFLALIPCVLVFLLVLHGEWMTGAFQAIVDVMFRRPVWAVLAATSPLLAGLLIGYSHMRRGLRRRAATRATTGHG